jgi:hypothetical protein
MELLGACCNAAPEQSGEDSAATTPADPFAFARSVSRSGALVAVSVIRLPATVAMGAGERGLSRDA